MILEIENPGVLQKTSDNAADPDGFAQALDSGHDPADPAHHQVDLNPGPGGKVKVVDGRLVDQAVDLDDDAGGAAPPGIAGLGRDHLLDLAVEIVRGDEKVAERVRPSVARHRVEEVGHLPGNRFAGGEVAEVGVEAGRLWVVVSGSEVGVVFQPLRPPTHHKGTLGVNLHPDHSVDDMDPGLLHLPGPLDIVGFIEPGLQFDQGRHLFAVLGGLDQRGHDRRIAACPVERLLDRVDGRIPGRLRDEFDHRLEGLVGVVEKDILSVDRIVDRFIGPADRGGTGGEGRVLQVGPVDRAEQAHQAEQVDRSVDLENVFLGELDVVEEDLEEGIVDPLLNLEADGRTPAQIAQLLLDRLEQVLGFLLVDIEVAVAGDAEGFGRKNPAAREKLCCTKLNYFAQENESAGSGLVRDQLDNPGQDPRNRQDGHHVLDLRGVRIVKGHQHVERLVPNLRERMGGIDRERGQDGEDLPLKVPLDPGLFATGQGLERLERDALLLERRDQLFVPAAVLVFHQRGDHRVDPPELLPRIKPLDAFLPDAGVDLLDQAGDADFEEFVEIGAHDGEKLQPFEQRRRFAGRQVEDPAVECEPAQFPIEIGQPGPLLLQRIVRLFCGISHAVGRLRRDRSTASPTGR